jgi:hypothetical protein
MRSLSASVTQRSPRGSTARPPQDLGNGGVLAPHRQHLAIRCRELLNAAVVGVGNIEIAGAVNRDSLRQEVLPAAEAILPPDGDVAGGIDLLHAAVERVGNVDISGAVHGHRAR